MSTIQVLISDLNGLLSDSKRRFSEIRNGCETAITHLKNYNPTMPIQNIKEEMDKQIVIKPFILACKSGNIKLTNVATPVIQKLILAHMIPEENIPELLQALLEASNLAIDIQLRILQCLPAFMQTYYFTGSNLLDLLSICSSLTANNKSPIVINAASATLQQLFTNIYDSIGEGEAPDSERVNEITIDEDHKIKVDNASFEGYRIFLDLCHLLDSEKPEFLTESIHIKFLSLLEIIENIIHGHQKLFQTHQELAFLLRSRVFPTLLKFLNSSAKNFPLVDRTIRIVHVLLSTQLVNLTIESEIALSYFSHLLLDDSEASLHNPLWEKVIVLEMFKSLFNDFLVIKTIFEKYDYSKGNKNVLKELFTVFAVYLQKHDRLVHDMVEPTPRLPLVGETGNSSPVYLSRTKSNIKPLILDHLDKSDPPTVIPATYPIYLIYQILVSFAEGAAKFVYNVYDESKDAATLEADVELANSLVNESTVDVSLLYEIFIYSSMDDETFLVLIKSFQKFTHATGLLGLTAARDRLLLILSKATIKNVGKTDVIPHPEASILQEQKKQLLAFGEQLVESISSTITGEDAIQNNSPSSTPALHSRYFNSRHVVCLRVLSSIATTLKSTLQSSWSIIWITFQWCDYYLEGPDQFSGFRNHKAYQSFTKAMLPQISAQDADTIRNTKKRLYESLGDSLAEVFRVLLGSLTELSDCAIEGADDRTELPVSPYNKTYFVNEIVHLCDVDKNHWLIDDDESWNVVSSYFVKLGSNRSLSFSLRGYIVETYTKVIESTSVAGFKNDNLIDKTSERTLDGLNRFLGSLIEMGMPQELLIVNCETEIHLKILTRLHDLIDKYDKNYQQSWKEVFQILNTPFKTVVGEHGSSSSDKVQLLVEKSFDTIKLILDEFMSTLPFDQFKLLIDTLANFVYQKYDLNISFSSVSYFWLISDSLKSRTVFFNSERGKAKPKLESEEDLVKFVETQKESYASYMCLDIYLLLSLSKISKDEINRAQVRDGAIQTFYQIIDVHGALLSNSWDLIYGIVLPSFFSIIPESRGKEWLESLQLVLSGFISLYSKFMMNDELDDIVDRWQQLFSYFDTLLRLQ
ncbi:Protein MON2 [Candida viswanathii]|uniref:Protein MON2 n=1 Tax=Candida viswanathii TaxID=5486 RepID=A0A367YE22_9ASCO|nr:Protein MON2 [Candida viswanathii]